MTHNLLIAQSQCQMGLALCTNLNGWYVCIPTYEASVLCPANCKCDMYLRNTNMANDMIAV